MHFLSECCKKIVGPRHVDPQLGSSELCFCLPAYFDVSDFFAFEFVGSKQTF